MNRKKRRESSSNESDSSEWVWGVDSGKWVRPGAKPGAFTQLYLDTLRSKRKETVMSEKKFKYSMKAGAERPAKGPSEQQYQQAVTDKYRAQQSASDAGVAAGLFATLFVIVAVIGMIIMLASAH